jgi:hypothetical protein
LIASGLLKKPPYAPHVGLVPSPPPSFWRDRRGLELSSAYHVDELRLIVHPVALGRGLALFAGVSSPLHLTLKISTTRFDSGMIANVYRPTT